MNWKKIGKWLIFPPPAVVGALFPLSLLLMLCCIHSFHSAHPFTIASYALSFYALLLLCMRTPDIIRFFRRFRQENRYYLRYRNDVQLRVNLSLYSAFGLNALYAVFQFFLGLWHHSAWFYAMAGYYLLLTLMRLTLVRHMRHHSAGEDTILEWHKYRFCGWLLMMMNLALAIFTLYFVFRIRTFLHHEITTIAMAAYTFTALTMAIINVIRYKKYGSPAYSAAKAISLVSAAVSMLTLENAMLTTFGQEDSEFFRQIILGLSGAAVICIVLAIALYMIHHANKALKRNHF